MTTRIDLLDGGWAEIRSAWEITRGQRKKLSQDIAPDEVTDAETFVIQLMVVSWDKGAVNEATIDALPVPVANQIAQHANELVKQLKPDFTPEAAGDPKADTPSSESSES